MISLILSWLVTTISFLIIARLPFLGIEIDSPGKAAIAAAVFGILNAILLPVLTILAFPFILITLGLFLFVVNSIIFELAAAIVPGFRLRYGFWSSTMGSLALAVINSILMAIVPPII
ncbi:hypothetical protein C7Y66_26620 [Chroococcidiopsis sp. CCALA 051]|uniref:phage holin family protein n=1 Tax=Chroococcidiopsis sp. CCALA 051 TaxID=869949 RepID=UPI000D0DD01D|nr:phage holin family protein [Chroococcidiopsis sp. CCALA 051]MBE9017744.1 phage holin family protein [Chroococcidiopsidales cyanobacterium LEGE 13417]PSM46147.1 hypothetical protein C7Y66_26620 [Chroococcidiopsis sp. CCALA 051]